MVLIIPYAKNGKNQHVTIHDPSIQELIRLLFRKKKRDDYVFSYTTSQYRRIFKQFINNLGLDKRYVPHSLRHGGATRFRHVFNWSVENVLERGRWQSIGSARRYIQSGKAVLLVDEIPESYIELGQQISKDILLYFRRYLPQ
jgi:integrase